MAEPWNPLGHAVLVDQVGVLLVGPLAALSWTALLPALARDEHAASSTEAAAAAPSGRTARPGRRAPNDRGIFRSIVCLSPGTGACGLYRVIRTGSRPTEGARAQRVSPSLEDSYVRVSVSEPG
jgi:hypothetical protein